MKIQTKEPWGGIGDSDSLKVFSNSKARARATISVAPAEGIRIGWSLFWRSLWWVVTRRNSIEFWMEDELDR